MKPLVVIPARGGSKALPGKNIKLLNGKPMIHYTIDAAREVFNDSQIIISTDSEEIKQIAELTGIHVPFLRPSHLATDFSSTQDVLLHAMDYYTQFNKRPDVVVLLQATSPLRTAKHIQEAWDLYLPDYDLLTSVKETDANPYYVLYEEHNSGYLVKSKTGVFTRRQDCPKVWELNGAIYIIRTEHLLNNELMNSSKIKKYEMNKEDSIDIDSIYDFLLAELILKRNADL